ncbi:MAG: phosphatase PAP2 family protein [Clostridia bacterium]|nr:phosphatase PAP2 family protein [Clostridia bacterium]
MLETIYHYDFLILDFLRDHLHCPFLDGVMPVFSFLGNGGALWLLVTLYLITTKKHRRHGVLLLIGLAVGFICVSLLLKPLIARPRPSWLMPEVLLLIPNPADFSFPSGHTMASFVAAFLLLKYRRPLGLAALPVAILIAFSRLYLYVHYPSDVLFSILLAAMVSFLIIKFDKRRSCSK